MNLLALDTSTPRAALGIARCDGQVFVSRTDPAMRHGRGLIPAIRSLLQEAGLSPRDLNALAVGLGPGSYTGLRIGLTAVKTIAYATGRPLVGLDSLEAIARNAPADALQVAVVADAQRGDFYTADFHRIGPGEPLIRVRPTAVESFDCWIARLTPGTIVIGPGLDRQTSLQTDTMRTVDPDHNTPGGHALLELAREAIANHAPTENPWFLEPIYLRRSAAEDQWDALGAPKQA